MITDLSLDNFKCFESIVVPFAPLTLLAGLNAAGKSSMLQALLLLRQSWLTFPGVPPLMRLQLNGDLVRIGTAQDVLYRDADEEAVGIIVHFGEPGIGRWFEYDREANVLSARSANNVGNEAGVERESLFVRDRFQYLAAERLGPRPSSEMSEMAVRVFRDLGPRGEYTTHFLSTYRDEPIRIASLAHPGAASQQLRQQVEAWMDFICPGTRLVVTEHPGMDVVQLQYQFVAGGQVTDTFRPTNVGFGLTYTLPILVAVLAAAPGSLILLENPEAHLHPQGQARMGGFLARAASAGVQIILETHSDHILNGIRIAVHDCDIEPDKVALHFFERQEGQDQIVHNMISPRIDRNGRLDKRPRGFFDEWDLSLRKLLPSAPKKE